MADKETVMLRILFFILLVFALGYGFSLLADLPGEVAITVAGQLITVDLITAAALAVAAIVAVMLVWWIIRVVLTSPMRARRFFRSRKRDRGYQSLSTGIIAAGAGDPGTARKMLKKANGLLTTTSEPLLDLLDAQTTMLEGDHEKARSKFETMLDDPETRALALRGLYVEAERLGDREAQKHYAEKAAELAPELAWAGHAAVNHKTMDGDWDGALRIVESQKSRGQITKDDAKRKRAVLLTAMAMDLVEAEPARAKSAALEAHKLAPGFAPAAVVCAEAAQRLNDMRRAVKVLETCWKKETHPDVALAYVNARPGDSAVDRLKRARKLDQLRPNTTDSSMIVARMALEAGEFDDARKAVGAVLRNEPRESAYMLMADIEDAETGNQGRMREWLARAVRAPRDPAWTADGYVSQRWAPFSPVTGRIDAFEWKVPVERLGGPLIENDLDPMQRGSSPALDQPVAESAGAGAVAGAVLADEKGIGAPVVDATVIEDMEEQAQSDAESSAGDASNESADKGPFVHEVEAPQASATGDATTGRKGENGDAEKAEAPIEAGAASGVGTDENDGDKDVIGQARSPDVGGSSAPKSANGAADQSAYSADEETRTETFVPDDPGTDDSNEEADKPRRFRLF
jgi:HemY protein